MRMVAGLAAGFTAVALYTVSMVDRGMNYDLIDAQITTASVDCFVKARRSKLVEKATNEIAYMDCALAPMAAKKFDYSESDIKKRAKLTFTYKSPVDGSTQVGAYEVSDVRENYKKGQAVKIYGHKTEPKKFRWH